MRLTFQLPTPPAILFSNGSNGNKFVRREATRKAIGIAKAEAERVMGDAGIAPPKWARARYWVTVFHKSSQVRDFDNVTAAIKGYIDGLALAGVIKNDRDLYPERPRRERVERMPRIEISIEEDV